MDTDDLQQNFRGYLNTPNLWQYAEVYDMQQYDFGESTSKKFTDKVAKNLRLGKLVERFVFQQLSDKDASDILAENIQIQDGKRTIGELDALLMTTYGPVHLEIIYKFYLYDPNVSNDELSHWIGPNRKDSLLQKLDKLKEKQLPLLYHPKTQPVLEDLELSITEIKQQVLFKAQLFLPLNLQKTPFLKLNPKCVQGFYVTLDKLYQFKTAQFYIPEKINWLMEVNDNVQWLDYDDFTSDVAVWLDKRMSPLFWMKNNGILQKFFVVWW